MRIQIVPKNKTMYRGCYRSIQLDGGLVLKKKAIDSLIKWYDKVGENTSISYSKENLEITTEIYNSLNENKLEVEIIFICEPIEKNVQGDFLGYDISGESFYYSPLFSAFFEKKLVNTTYKFIYSEFATMLNKNGLFDDLPAASGFAKIARNLILSGIFEFDKNVRPFAIYGVL